MASPASAQTTKWLTSGGTGAPPCTRGAPCGDLASASPVAGDNFRCVNSGSYGNFVATFAYSIGCTAVDASVNFLDFSGTSATDVVNFGGIKVACGNAFPNRPAITFTGAGILRLKGMRITNCDIGISFQPSGPSTLLIEDTLITGHVTHGLFIRPSPGGYANVHLRNVEVQESGNGFYADGSNSSIGVNVNMDTVSSFANNLAGITAVSAAGKAPVSISITRSQISGNYSTGLLATGLGAAIEVNDTTITSNNNGVATSGGGQVRTFGNNQLRFNSVNGTFTGTVALQ